MPLIRPEIQEVLRSAGILPEKSEEKISIQESLEGSGLGLPELAEELVSLAKHSGNEGIRLRALEIGAKLHGILKESQQSPRDLPQFNIIIQTSRPSGDPSEILFPRSANGGA